MISTDNKTIGRVLSVDNFRVFIKIDEDLKGAYKNGVNDIYEIARINSYLIIPVGADRVVALVTRVTMKEETEFDHTSNTISLPNSARYVSATMLGTIVSHNDGESFIQGVYNFPTLDNPVWYVTEKDLRHIFDDKDSYTIDYSRDYYLPIGTSPAFPSYRVKICPDQMFVKHAAILGNTGSGKSCTLTSILRNLFRYKYNDDHLQNAHFVIFDTNGEYKDAFMPLDKDYDDLSEGQKNEIDCINAYYYGGEGYPKVPYWFMNWSDFKGLLRPSEGSQAPVLNRAIGLAKNADTVSSASVYPNILIQRLQDVLNHIMYSGSDYWKIMNYKDSIDDIKNRGIILTDGTDLNSEISKIYINGDRDYTIPSPSQLEEIIASLQHIITTMSSENLKHQVLSEQNIDLPTWFSYNELCEKFLDAAISQQEHNGIARLNEYISTLRLRMNSFLNDKRIAIPLMLNDNECANREILKQFLALILGDYNKNYGETDQSFLHEYNNSAKPKSTGRTSQISILDVSNLPFEVLDSVTALIGRIILEFVSHFLNRGKYPIVLVLEEAQNYIAENKESVAKQVFERIAREGRKFGISLIVCSQRPSELSKTVLSQCNSFIIHRLQNPEDQKYIRGLVSSANADILEQLPVIPQQHAIITGDCVRTPIQVRIDDVHPTPNSHNPLFVENWLNDENKIPYDETCGLWLKDTKDDNNAS